jgi:hypothetical protein
MSSDAKRSPVQNTAVQSASNVLTLNSSWTAINAIMMAKNTTLENFYRENSLHIPNVSNHVFAQGCRSFHYLRPITFLPVAFLINLSHSLYYCFFFLFKRYDNEPAKFVCTKSDCSNFNSHQVPGCINIYGDLNECCSTSIICGIFWHYNFL